MAQVKERLMSFEEAKDRYVHRYTMEHVPQWATRPRSDGTFYAPQYRTDREWYDKTLFPGEGGWEPDDTSCCSMHQSWPLGLWLTEGPYDGQCMTPLSDAALAVVKARLGGVDG